MDFEFAIRNRGYYLLTRVRVILQSARKGAASAPPSIGPGLEGPLGPEAKPLQGLKPRNDLARLAAGLKPRPSASDEYVRLLIQPSTRFARGG